MHPRRHAGSLTLALASLGLFVGHAGCDRPDPDDGSLLPPDGFSRYPAAEPIVELTPETQENPWIVGFGGAGPSRNSQSADEINEGKLSGGSTGTAGVLEANEPDEPLAEEPTEEVSMGGPESPKPLLERRLVRYLEGEGSDKLLGFWGEPGASPVECRVEIYSNGGTSPWRTINLPNEFPQGGSLTVCSLPDDHPECTASLSGSLYNGNDALVVSCGQVVMDSFGRVGEDPGVAWTSEDEALRSEGQDLVRCGQTRRLDPYGAFALEDEWTRVQNGESPEDARSRCASLEAPGEGGAGAFPL